MDFVASVGLMLLGVVLGELWHWLRDERGTSEANYYREAAGSVTREITEQRQQAEAAMRRAVQSRVRRP
jgi:hypothetical protein